MARSKRLTQSMVDSATPRKKEYALPDDQVPGLILRVRPSGARAWVLRKTYEGKTRRITLGTPEEMSLVAARKAAALGGLDGGTVTTTASKRGTVPTLGEVAALYLKDREGPTSVGRLQAVRVYLRSQLLPQFGTTPLDEIRPPAVAHWFIGYSRKSPGGANMAIALIRTLYNFARHHELVRPDLPDPTGPIPRNRRRPRGRLISGDQMEELGRVLADWPDQTVADAVRLIFLTGCRSGEIIRLRWSEVALGNQALHLKRTKTGPREVALSEEASALLARRRRLRMGEAVFPKPKRPDVSLRTIPTVWRSIRKAAGLGDDVRLHDLRHSYASHSIMSGETRHMTGKLLGHARVVSTDRYAHLDGEFVAAAAERVSALVDGMMRGR
ncbi:MAG: site-specific integrase [Pseudomonadota bacterium]